MPKILFICSDARVRSLTAADIFKAQPNVRALATGLNNDSEPPVSSDLIQWADTICVMENAHKQKLVQRFGGLLKGTRICVLGIPDNFEYMQPELVKLLNERVPSAARIPALNSEA